MKGLKLASIGTAACVVVGIIVFAIVLVTQQNDIVRDVPNTSSTTTVTSVETTQSTVSSTSSTNATSATSTTSSVDSSSDDVTDTTTAITTSPSANYVPSQTISGKADVVDSTDNVGDGATVTPTSSPEYEDVEIEVVVLPTVVTPGATMKAEPSSTSAPSDTDTSSTDIFTPPAMDEGVVEDDTVGVELEDVTEEDNFPSMLP